MNPRRRRLLIPVLLIALIVVTLIAAIRDATAAEPSPVSTIDDARITEASGMAVSRSDKNLAYVINDSDNAQQVYAVERSSGRVVGTNTVTSARWRDPEAMTIDSKGTLWIADTGDNLSQRDDVALFSMPEPGRGDRTISATMYRLSYGGKRFNIEALLADPRDDRLYLVTKTLFGAKVLALPKQLRTDSTNRSIALRGTVASLVTDGVFSADGEHAYLLSAVGAVVEYRTAPAGWTKSRKVGQVRLPQPETLALDAGGKSLLVGTEGRPSALVRMQIASARADSTVAAGIAVVGVVLT